MPMKKHQKSFGGPPKLPIARAKSTNATIMKTPPVARSSGPMRRRTLRFCWCDGSISLPERVSGFIRALVIELSDASELQFKRAFPGLAANGGRAGDGDRCRI